MHNNGKKHQRLQRAREERKASTERSIYVRGFENTITLEWDLNDYFSKFGKVASVFIDKEKAKYAIVEFECQTEAEKILNSKQLPLFNGKHLIIKKRTLKEPTKESPKQFSNSRKAKVNSMQEKTGFFLNEEVLEKIKCSTTLHEQMLAVVSSTCLTEDDLKLRDFIVQYLQEIFVEVFPACVVTTFGSTTTGLGLKGADIDLCLLVDPESLNQILDKDDSLPYSSDLTSQALEFIACVLRQFAAGFQNVVSVTTAKCPLVKFIHRDSGLTCDLSVNNRLAIRNTELIKSYVALDDRIRPLAITLKNWAAAKRLTGSGGHQISNYCLVLMLLHFLQRTRPPVIPVLQQAHESEPMLLEDARTTTTDKIFIDGWDCSFMSTAAEMSPNKESLGTLLKDWFYYYGTTFDYENEVITVQNDTDKRVWKMSIEKNLSQAAVKSSIFRQSALCVQDPFELSHNLTHNVTVESLRRFMESCTEAHTTLSSNSEPSVDSSVAKTSAFIKLFAVSTCANQRPKKTSYSFTIPFLLDSLKLKGSKTFAGSPLHQTCEFILHLLNDELQIICEFQPDKQAGECTETEKLFSNIEPMPDEDEICEDNMCIDDDVNTKMEFSSTSGKRLREDEEPDDHGAKRIRINREDENTTFNFLCKATQITWQNRRRQKRLQTANDDTGNGADCCHDNSEKMTEMNRLEGKNSQCYVSSASQTKEIGIRNPQSFLLNRSNVMEVSSPASNTIVGNYTTSHPASMEFKLTISEHTEKGLTLSFHQQCDVVLTHLRGSLPQFANFYGFFKKFVAQKIAGCV